MIPISSAQQLKLYLHHISLTFLYPASTFSTCLENSFLCSCWLTHFSTRGWRLTSKRKIIWAVLSKLYQTLFDSFSSMLWVQSHFKVLHTLDKRDRQWTGTPAGRRRCCSTFLQPYKVCNGDDRVKHAKNAHPCPYSTLLASLISPLRLLCFDKHSLGKPCRTLRQLPSEADCGSRWSLCCNNARSAQDWKNRLSGWENNMLCSL